MTPERRREAVLQAALPLVAEYGAAVTTQQIARAAGIGDATIFRVFTDKDELLHACLERALDPAITLEELRGIDVDQPLAARLLEAAEALSGYLNRMGTVIGALQITGFQRPRSRTSESDTPRGGARTNAQAQTREAITELIAPDQDRLRLPATTLADVFLSLLFGRGRVTGDPEISAEALIDLLLHGVVTQ